MGKPDFRAEGERTHLKTYAENKISSRNGGDFPAVRGGTRGADDDRQILRTGRDAPPERKVKMYNKIDPTSVRK